jgi:hypothetical protein
MRDLGLFQYALIKAGLDEEVASGWASYYIDVRDRLHGGCFYGLTYEEEEHRPLMDKIREYDVSLVNLRYLVM